MLDFPDMRHNPPRVLTVVAITCRQCEGRQMYTGQDERLNACHECENGYEKVMVPVEELHVLVRRLSGTGLLHATIVRLAEANHVRLPVLTHNTANLATHLLPRTPRIPLQRIADSPKE